MTVGEAKDQARDEAGVLELGQAATDPAITGRKAARLAWLAGEGLPVPAGAVIPVATVAMLHEACDGDPTPDALMAAEPPAALRAAVAEAVDRLGEGPLAVRSTGIAEDAEDSSQAGRYTTVLGVQGFEEALDAVRRCAASALDDRLLGAVAPNAEPADGTGAEMAVLIQRLIGADAAGVAFTADPVTGDRESMRVSAVRGLGDRLVSGAADPDEWLVDGEGARCLTAPEGALEADQVMEVAELARRAEELDGSPQDIEWALAEGKLYLLQSRPITALPVPPEIEPPPGPWQKDTVHYTGPISPLAASAYLPRLEAGSRRMLSELGFPMEDVRQRAIGWEVYMQPVPPSSEEAMAERFATAREALGRDLPGELVERWWRGGWRTEYSDRIDSLRLRDLSELDPAGLEAHLDDCLELLADGQETHFLLFAPWLLAAFDLATTCEELLDWSTGEALELVSGLSESSSEPHRELTRIADDLRDSPAACEVVRSWQPGEPAGTLLTRLEDTDAALAERLRSHLDRYGCRLPAYDVREPTFGERPELALRPLRDLVTGAGRGVDLDAELARRREDAAARARAAIAEREDAAAAKERFEAVLARAHEVWGLREDNVLLTDAMPNGLLRLAALEAGRRLTASGRLRRPDDAVWLELDELRAALRDAAHAPADLPRRVARRRAEHAWVLANPGPPAYGEPPPPPPLDALPDEARRLAGAMGWAMGEELAPAEGASEGGKLRGLPGSPGRVTAPVRIVRSEAELESVEPGEVVVCPLTTPAWTSLFARVAAVVTDHGSPLSHAAIVAREHAIPAVVGAGNATSLLTTGQTVTVDGATGSVEIEAA